MKRKTSPLDGILEFFAEKKRVNSAWMRKCLPLVGHSQRDNGHPTASGVFVPVIPASLLTPRDLRIATGMG